jgi:LPS sulfotransferase NodH
MIPQVGVAVCTTPRSGSNLLCAAMTATGLLGCPKEYFNRSGRRRYDDPDYPREADHQVARILQDGCSSNGVYSFKVFPGQGRKVMRTVDWTAALPNLRYVYLSRGDLLAQAISLDLSQQTGTYRSTDHATVRPTFNPRRIRNLIGSLATENAVWERFFAQRGVQPLRIRYEEACLDLPSSLIRIGQLVGVTITPDPDWRPELAVQRNATNRDWRERYLKWEGSSRRFLGGWLDLF